MSQAVMECASRMMTLYNLAAPVSAASNRLFSAQAVPGALRALNGQPFGELPRLMDISRTPASSVSRRERRLAQRQLLYPQNYAACLVDAAGTLLVPSENTAEVYHQYAAKYTRNPLPAEEMLHRFRRAYNKPWAQSPIRYVGDGRVFWSHIVKESTGVDNPQMFEELYLHYAQPRAWNVTPGAADALRRMRDSGVALAVVSNFDTRLKPLLDGLHIADLFDAVVVSAEVGWEKPNRCIFEAALDALGVAPQDAVHVGDDRRNDVWGARDAGVHAWLWGADIVSFDQLAYRVLHGSKLKQWDEEDQDEYWEAHGNNKVAEGGHKVSRPDV